MSGQQVVSTGPYEGKNLLEAPDSKLKSPEALLYGYCSRR
jgi:hypothetical protein